jgi:hypothetical protein
MPQVISDPVADISTTVHTSEKNDTRRKRRTDAMAYVPDASQIEGEDDSTASTSTGTFNFMPLWPGSNIDRREFVRLTMQALAEMGYR